MGTWASGQGPAAGEHPKGFGSGKRFRHRVRHGLRCRYQLCVDTFVDSGMEAGLGLMTYALKSLGKATMSPLKPGGGTTMQEHYF